MINKNEIIIILILMSGFLLELNVREKIKLNNLKIEFFIKFSCLLEREYTSVGKPLTKLLGFFNVIQRNLLYYIAR